MSQIPVTPYAVGTVFVGERGAGLGHFGVGQGAAHGRVVIVLMNDGTVRWTPSTTPENTDQKGQA